MVEEGGKISKNYLFGCIFPYDFNSQFCTFQTDLIFKGNLTRPSLIV